MWSNNYSYCRFLILILIILIVNCVEIKEETFDNLKNNPTEMMAVFYHKSNKNSKKILKNFKKAAKKIKNILPHVIFYKCDGDLSINRKAFQNAKFQYDETYIFTSTPEAGIEKYSGSRSVDKLVRIMTSKYLPYDESDLIKFKNIYTFYDRLDHDERPQFVRFINSKCKECKRTHKTFRRAATYFKDKVDFLEIICDGKTTHQKFCVQQGTNNKEQHPLFVLYNGEEKYFYDEKEYSVPAWEIFFSQHGFKFTENEIDVEPSLVRQHEDQESAIVKQEKSVVKQEEELSIVRKEYSTQSADMNTVTSLRIVINDLQHLVDNMNIKLSKARSLLTVLEQQQNNNGHDSRATSKDDHSPILSKSDLRELRNEL